MPFDFSNLNPGPVWSYFYDLSQIPRCSKHEERVITYIEEFAEKHNLPYKKDNAGNICISKPASSGFESRPAVVLQGHVDMVCEKNTDVQFDFNTEGLKLKREGEWITAEGTTLGADNGIAVAMALAVLADSSLTHGPLEALFTVDEETGLTGAANLDPSMVSGDILFNIDSEEEGIFYIGCAGGITTIGTIPVSLGTSKENTEAYSLRITGLRGGHSGAEIHEGRGNSVVFCSRILKALTDETKVSLFQIDGGDKHNAIPRECSASFTVGEGMEEQIVQIVEKYRSILPGEYSDIEPDLKVELIKLDSTPEKVLSASDSVKIIDALFILPHGVIGMSRKLPGLVETSTNLAAVHLKDSTVTILTSQRSSTMSALDHIALKVRTILTHAGAEIKLEGEHPAWDPDPDSGILKTFKKVYTELTGKEPEVTAIHAGLECGVLGEKFENMEMISFGPDMEEVHTPNERLSIPSVERTWNFLLNVLKEV